MRSVPAEKQLSILRLLVEGCSLRSVHRLTRVHRDTAARLMVRAGDKCKAFLNARMRNLSLAHVECDELWTYVLKKQGRLRGAEINNPLIGDQYLFIGIDEATKLIPAFIIGKRTSETAELFMQDLAARICLPHFLEIGPRPLLSTDGWVGYPNVVDNAFASRADYGKSSRPLVSPSNLVATALQNSLAPSGASSLAMLTKMNFARVILSAAI
jgi:hypothetical protein